MKKRRVRSLKASAARTGSQLAPATAEAVTKAPLDAPSLKQGSGRSATSRNVKKTAAPIPRDTLSFLQSLNPPLSHLHKTFIELGFRDMTYITALASWSDDDLVGFLKSLEGKLSRVDIEIFRIALKGLK